MLNGLFTYQIPQIGIMKAIGALAATERRVPGGILIADAVAYDALSRVVLGSLYRSVAADEVGCGPVHLSIRLARRHGLDVTAIDLHPAMIERARANGDCASATATAQSERRTRGAELPMSRGSIAERSTASRDWRLSGSSHWEKKAWGNAADEEAEADE